MTQEIMLNMGKAWDCSADMVNSTCHHLFKNTPIKFFGYFIFRDWGVMSSYVSDPDLTMKILRGDLMPTYNDLSIFGKYGIRSSFLSHNVPLSGWISDIDREKFNTIISHASDHGSYNALLIVDRFKDYYRYCIFAVTVPHKSIFSFYINNFSQINKFINYFENNCKALLEIEHNNILLPYYNAHEIAEVKAVDFIVEEDAFDFLNEKTQKEIHRGSMFTQREKECLTLISQGYTMKNTAIKLNISHRTVEQHLRNLKDKLGLNTKNQLVEAWHLRFKDDTTF